MCWLCQVPIKTRFFRLRRALRRWFRFYAAPEEIARKFSRRLDPSVLRQWATMDNDELARHHNMTGSAFRLEYGLWDDGYPFHDPDGAEGTSLAIFQRVRDIALDRFVY